MGSGLLTYDAEEFSEFAIAVPNKNFVWADSPVNPDLYNSEGLLVPSFRTDNF